MFEDKKLLNDSKLVDDEPDEIESAFDKIREQVAAGLADCDEKLEDIAARLPDDEPEPIAPVESAPKADNQTPLNNYVNRMAESPAPMSDKARATLRAAGGASWQLLLGFGISFAVRVGVLGVLLGSWLDKRFFGGNGFAAMGCILLAIAYSFFMLYRDVMRQEKLQKEEVAKAMQQKPGGKNGR